jgi:hypothetical protein
MARKRRQAEPPSVQYLDEVLSDLGTVHATAPPPSVQSRAQKPAAMDFMQKLQMDLGRLTGGFVPPEPKDDDG